jgi:hypothetical protein
MEQKREKKKKKKGRRKKWRTPTNHTGLRKPTSFGFKANREHTLHAVQCADHVNVFDKINHLQETFVARATKTAFRFLDKVHREVVVIVLIGVLCKKRR